MDALTAIHLIGANADFLAQAQRLLEGMSDEEYKRRDAATGRGRVGAHLRHVLDHYGSLLDGCALGIVDYDQRRREEALETSRAAAKARIAHVLSELRALEHLAATTPLVVLLDCGRGGARSSTNSTLGRELQFLASHTVHHYAVVGLILAARGQEGQSLRLWHGLASAMYLAQWLCALGVLWRLARRP